jgi:hypothetical protein
MSRKIFFQTYPTMTAVYFFAHVTDKTVYIYRRKTKKRGKSGKEILFKDFIGAAMPVSRHQGNPNRTKKLMEN